MVLRIPEQSFSMIRQLQSIEDEILEPFRQVRREVLERFAFPVQEVQLPPLCEPDPEKEIPS